MHVRKWSGSIPIAKWRILTRGTQLLRDNTPIQAHTLAHTHTQWLSGAHTDTRARTQRQFGKQTTTQHAVLIIISPRCCCPCLFAFFFAGYDDKFAKVVSRKKKNLMKFSTHQPTRT